MEFKMFNRSKGNRQENGRGQAKGHNQIRVQEVQSGRQAGGQVEWSGRRVQSPEQARVKTGWTRKRRKGKAGKWEKPLVGLDIQDELAQRDRKHRYKYTGENKRQMEGVETIMRTGETDQGVTGTFFSSPLPCNSSRGP